MSEYNEFIDHNEQIKRLREKGIIIDNEFLAVTILSAVPYKYLIRSIEKFQPIINKELTIEYLYLLHTELNNLNTILLKYILITEQSLKNKLSYLISKKYGVETDHTLSKNYDTRDYLCIDHYKGKRINIIEKLKDTICNPYTDSSMHTYLKESQNIPPWILLENIPLGKVIKWYSILKNEDKTYISKSLFFNQPKILNDDEVKELVIKSLEILHEYRNLFAHRYREHEEFIKNELPKNPYKKEYFNVFYFDNEYKNNIGKNDLQALLTILGLFAPTINDVLFLIDDLKNFNINFNKKITLYQHDHDSSINTYKLYGLPEDILVRLVKFVKSSLDI